LNFDDLLVDFGNVVLDQLVSIGLCADLSLNLELGQQSDYQRDTQRAQYADGEFLPLLLAIRLAPRK